MGVYRVGGVEPANGGDGFIYKLRRLPSLKHLDGRTIVDFNKNFRACYLVGHKYKDDLVVNSVRPERMSVADFPGFNAVLLSFEMLQSIIRQDNPSWRAALANIAGVYVIADRETGYQYMGSAYGGVGLWERWSQYARTGHGGNSELRRLLRKKGEDYVPLDKQRDPGRLAANRSLFSIRTLAE